MIRIYFWATLGVIWLLLLPNFYGQSPDNKDLILSGSGVVAGENIRHPSGNIFNQILLTGQNITLQAKPYQITRVSFMDVNEDIVQVEFSGAGTLTVTLDPNTYLPPALPSRYNQNVKYVTGKPSILVDGANSSTFLSIFTVGKVNAVNQTLFPAGQRYDAQADVKLVEVINSIGFGGMQLANVLFSESNSRVGIDARDVPIAVRLTVGDIDASGSAVPYLLFGSGSFTVPASNSGLRITGGDLFQTNDALIIAISEADNLISQRNIKSDGSNVEVKGIRGTFNFIDLQVIIFAPESLNNKIYNYFLEDSGELVLTQIYFEGSPGGSSGTFDRFKVAYQEDVLVSDVLSGSFTSEIDSVDSNKIHVSMIPRDAFLFADNTVVWVGTVKQLAFRIATPVAVLFYIEMNFLTPTSGTCLITALHTNGVIESNRGIFTLYEQ